MIITAVTLTGDRQETFELCKQWMAEQTRRADQWLIIDDGEEPTEPPKGAEYVRREPKKGGEHSLIMNMKTALPLITGDAIIFFEDDEYYSPRYVEEMAKRLEQYEVVGICPSRYYHLFSSRYMNCNNDSHASLAQTGIRKSFLPEVEKMLNGSPFIDGKIWERVKNAPVTYKLFSDAGNPLYVAMKGMMGRPGVGNGHRNLSEQTPDSPRRKVLKEWIPNTKHFQIYEAISEKYKVEGKAFMGRYRAKTKGYISHLGLIEAGQIFEYFGLPGSWMVPVEETLEPYVEPKNSTEADTLSGMTKAFAEKKGIIPPPGSTVNRIPKPGETTPQVPMQPVSAGKGGGKKR